jgi:monofunctional glycosyltransferase
MIFTADGRFLPAVMTAGEYIDVKAALANALGTVIGGLFLTVIYFAFAQKLLRLPRLSGAWILESVVSQTKYNPFKGMVLRYKVLLLQDGAKLHGTAEKVYEKSDKVRVFTGIDRTTATLDGTIHKAYVGRSTIVLHVAEEGAQRSFSWIMEARCRGLGRRMHLTGQFSSTAGDASGTVVLERIQHSYRLDEYRGLPLYWFSRLIEITTSCLYGNEWNRLREKVNSLAVTAEQFWKTHNCHLLVAALVLAEDRRFYSHGGADPVAICRALFRTIVKGNIQGGSTIEQQLVRRLTSDYRKSVERKLKEVTLAVRLRRVLRKDQIPVAYLVSAYYGWHMNGVRQAAQRLSIDLRDPTVEGAAHLIARIRYPEPRHVSLNRSMLIGRRQAWIARELGARIHLLY